MNCWSLLICSEVTQPLRCRGPHLDWGTVLSTNKKMAFSEGSWMRFLMIHMNWATVMSEGTRYFLLSMSTICDPDTFSTITWQETRRDNDYSRHATKQISCKPAAMPLRRHSPGPCQGTCCGFWRTLCIDVLVDRKNNSHVNHVFFSPPCVNRKRGFWGQTSSSVPTRDEERWWTRSISELWDQQLLWIKPHWRRLNH